MADRARARAAGSCLAALAALAACATAARVVPAPGRWAAQITGARTEIRSLSTAGADVALFGGKFGAYTLTTDGGRTWRADTVRGAARLFFTGAYAEGSSRLTLVGTDFEGSYGRIVTSADGGRTWTTRWERADAGTFLDGLACWSAERCVAFGDPTAGRFLILRTDDGARWTRVPDAAIPEALPGEAAFAASGGAIVALPGGHAWIGTGGGAHARVYHSADYGRTWTAADTPMPGGKTSGIFGLAFRDPLHGVAVGGDYARPREGADNVLVTDDGGRTWTVAGTAQTPGVRYGAAWIPGTRSLVAVGPSGSGRSDDGGRTWTAIDTVGFNTVRFAGPAVGWAAGVEGQIARYVGR